MIASLRECVICRDSFAAGRSSKGLLCGAYDCRAEWSRRNGGRRRADGTARPAPLPAVPRPAGPPKKADVVGPPTPTAATFTWPPRGSIPDEEPAPAGPPSVEKPIRTVLQPQLAAFWKEANENTV